VQTTCSYFMFDLNSNILLRLLIAAHSKGEYLP